jgi:hypothetical protein
MMYRNTRRNQKQALRQSFCELEANLDRFLRVHGIEKQPKYPWNSNLRSDQFVPGQKKKEEHLDI